MTPSWSPDGPKTGPRWPRDGLRWLKIVPRAPNTAEERRRLAQDLPKIGPPRRRWPKLGPRALKTGPRKAPERPKSAKDGPMMGPRSPKMAQERPIECKCRKNFGKTHFWDTVLAPKRPQDGSKTAPRRPQDDPRRPQDSPNMETQICIDKS